MTFRKSLLTAAAVLALATPATAQDDPRGMAINAGASVGEAGWQAPRTPWGDPDLRGTWPLDRVGRTPTERPAQLGDKAYLTDEEYAEAMAQADAVAANYEEEDAKDEIGSGHWFEWGTPLKQTSLIMAPANGRIPPLTEQGEAMSAAMRSSWNVTQFDAIADFNTLDRCMSRGLPSSMTPFPYNNGIRVFQAPGYVVLNLELVHETRIIPIADGQDLPGHMRQYLGSSWGEWDGDTLVIHTTNLTGETPMNIVGPGNKPIPTSRQQTVVERLTPVGPDTIFYEATVSDPVVLTEPFKLAFPWTRDDGYEMFEYACHEGNTVVRNYIQTTSPRFVGELEDPSDPAEWVRDTVER
ncbi:hypothetical protein [Alteraurantiacibacter aquimixticola]|uniref:Uncharacterized protein n=1 Tax=Alteraurantiacibacter aquimixticola TaxID=2489173 RepID=A0A4T3F129_9SPHN|nr:hypothetical protein [Alteraurantiacibacter aquimixticola]TIX50664.1 hypothetical protein E5222_10445 [Alteraurantiacibacter aquimixticola]